MARAQEPMRVAASWAGCNRRWEADMKKGTMLLIGVIILILGGLVYQFLLHPNPYTGKSPAEESGAIDPN